jgi:putative membrane protein
MKRILIIGGLVGVVAVTAVSASTGGAVAGTPQSSAPYKVDRTGEKAKPNDPGALTQNAAKDHLFMTQAAAAGITDVLLGRLAARKATDQSVRQFGQQMMDAYSRVNTELKYLAKSKQLTLDQEISDDQRATVRRLSALDGAAFDRAVMNEMLAKYTRDRALFQRTARRGTDPAVKAWAAKILPAMQEHQQHAEGIARKLAGASRQTASRMR